MKSRTLGSNLARDRAGRVGATARRRRRQQLLLPPPLLLWQQLLSRPQDTPALIQC
jgi:hypothetical protein